MKNSELSDGALKQLIDIAKSQVDTATEALDRAHKRYLSPRDDADFQNAKRNMDTWGDRQFEAIRELEDLKAELERRILA